MTKLQQKIIRVYEETKQVKIVYLSYRQLAKRAGCSLALAFRTINTYKKAQKKGKVHESNTR